MSEETEITPAMVAAGIDAYCRWDRRVEETEGLVYEVYEAMSAARRRDAVVERDKPGGSPPAII
jgi:hypothetical protein